MKSKVFISYSRKDLDYARRIVSDITDKTGVIPWIDLEGIESGRQFLEVIVSAIDACEILVCLLSRNSLESSYVRKELTYALHIGKTVFLLETEEVEIPDWLWALYDGKYYLPREEGMMMDDIGAYLKRENSSPTPDIINGHKCVDLGLSVLWATCNMGADAPFLPGDYYAWGETESRRDSFPLESYALCVERNGILRYTKYNEDDSLLNLDETHDAARCSWEKPWRMPTREEIAELLDNCVFTYIDGPLEAFGGQQVRGCVVTSRINRRSIFLPLTGLQAKWGHNIAPSEMDLSSGLFWSSTHSPYRHGCVVDESDAYILCFNQESLGLESDSPLCRRYNGLCIRPVADLKSPVPAKHNPFSDCTRKIRNGKDIFISYLDTDQDAFNDIVRMIDRETDLKAVSSRVDDIYEDKDDAIKALRRCRVAVFILSKTSAHSSEMRKRVHYAQERGKVVIAVWTDLEDPSGWVLFELEPGGIIRSMDDAQMSHLASLLKAMTEIPYPDMTHPTLHRSPLASFSEGLAAFYENGLWGFRDTSGKTIIRPQFISVGDFHDGWAIAGNYRRYGFIDTRGRWVLRCDDYDRMGAFHDGLSYVWQNEKRGFIDRKGRMVIPAAWDLAESFSEGRAMVTKDGKDGFIDRTGTVVIPFRYKLSEAFSEGLAAVMDEDDRWGYINKEGRTIIRHKYRSACSFREGKAYVLDEEGPLFIDQNGERCFETSFIHRVRGSYFQNGRALVTDLEDEDWYIDEKGQFINRPDGCEGFLPFREGLAVVVRNDKAGYIEKNGRIVIDCIYDGACSFHEGLAAVRIASDYFYIDSSGKRVNP